MTRSGRRPERWIALVCALPLAWGIWRFDFLCDDAFISFRYARNLARGLGLVYNPGEVPPVEGYTNLLWVLLLAAAEALGLASPLAARVVSVGCAAALFGLLASHLGARARSDLAPAAGLLFLATLPSVAVWSTGGLETMAFSLAAFALYDRLQARGGSQPSPGALLALAALLGLRADGFVWALLVLCALAVPAWLRGDGPLLGRCLRAAALGLVLLAALLAWRWFHYATLAPNTARVKVSLGALSLERGGLYLANYLASLPSCTLALALSAVLLGRRGDARLWPAALCVAGNFAYVVLVGGDFMAMGRFLVPGMPFVAVLLAGALDPGPSPARHGRARAALGPVVLVAIAALGLAASLDRSPVPRSWRARLNFRLHKAKFESELERWESARLFARAWTLQGRVLERITAPGDSLVIGTIGAVGYYSGLVIHDSFGLVNREELSDFGELGRRSAGHERRVPLATFVAKRPTFLAAGLVPLDAPERGLREELAEGGEFAEHAAVELVPLGPDEVLTFDPSGGAWALRLVRFVP